MSVTQPEPFADMDTRLLTHYVSSFLPEDMTFLGRYMRTGIKKIAVRAADEEIKILLDPDRLVAFGMLTRDENVMALRLAVINMLHYELQERCLSWTCVIFPQTRHLQ